MNPGDLAVYTIDGFDPKLRRIKLSEITLIIGEAAEYRSSDLRFYRVLLPNTGRVKLLNENFLQVIS